MMKASEIEHYCKNEHFLNKHYAGVVSLDTIPLHIALRQFVIVNTDYSYNEDKHTHCYYYIATLITYLLDLLRRNVVKLRSFG